MRRCVEPASMKRCITASLFVVPVWLFAQQIPLGTWQTHFSYYQARHLAYGNNKIFCAVDNGCFSFDTGSNSIQKLSKVTGLSDVDISAINYSKENDLLLIGYSSGGIDLISKDGIQTIDDLRRTDLVEQKAITDIITVNNLAFLACPLGIIVIRLDKMEIVENYRSIGSNGSDVAVYDLIIHHDSLYAYTDQGIRAGMLSDNLLDFNNWTPYPETLTDKFDNLFTNGETLYCVKNDTLISRFDGSIWVDTPIVLSDPVVQVIDQDGTYIATGSEIFSFNGSSVLSKETFEGIQINDFFMLANTFWIASEEKGLLNSTTHSSIIPPGPQNDSPSRVAVLNDDLYLLYGPLIQQFNGEIDSLGYSKLSAGEWSLEEIDGFYNLTDVVSLDHHIYFSSLGFGLYNSTANLVINHENSDLSDSKSGMGLLITDLTTNDGVWATSYQNIEPVIRITSAADIQRFNEDFLSEDSPLDQLRILIYLQEIRW